MGNRPISVIGTAWDNMNRNAMEQNRKDTKQGLDELESKIAASSNDVAGAKADAANALAAANAAQNTAESVQSQLDDIVIEAGSSNPEIVQARTDQQGTTYPTLKANLDAKDAEITNVQSTVTAQGTDVTKLKNGEIGTAIKKDVQTTQGRFWQTTITQVNVTQNNEERQVMTVPTSFKKKIVLIGSSSAQGNGVEDYTTTSFWALLKGKLEPKGYEVINRGFSADNTTKGLDRFYKDVITANPDFVIIAFTLGNEGMTTAGADKNAVYQQFKNNILKMCYQAKQIGATPIIMTQAPTRSYTVDIYAYSQKLNAELQAMGFHVVDWGGPVDALDGTGKPIDSIMYDNVHYKEAAHKEIANAFPPTLFDRGFLENGGYLRTQLGYINTNTITSETPIFYDITDITTFSAFMRFKKGTAEVASLMSFSGGIRCFLDANGAIIFNDGPSGSVIIANDINYANNSWHSLGVTYSPIDQQVRFFVNGVLKHTRASAIIPNKWTIGGRAGSTLTFKNGSLKDFALYRTRLSNEQIMQMHAGMFSQMSLEIYSPGHDRVLAPGVPLINLAPTTVNLQINPSETALTATSSPTV
jgi:hypothetical protein